MEKITASQFGKFEGFELMNSQLIKGGLIDTATGSGSYRIGRELYICWTSDCLDGSSLSVDDWYYSTYDVANNPGAC